MNALKNTQAYLQLIFIVVLSSYGKAGVIVNAGLQIEWQFLNLLTQELNMPFRN